jgi:Cation efflux family
MGRFSGKKCRLLSVMSLTISFFFVEIITGYVTNSMSLVADSFHMLGDIAALLISFLSVRVSFTLAAMCLHAMIVNFRFFTDVTEKVEQKHVRLGTS